MAVSRKNVASRDVTSCCVVDGRYRTQALRRIPEEICFFLLFCAVILWGDPTHQNLV